jgi:pimeloyl-ACP methyl ester carboxylesterase
MGSASSHAPLHRTASCARLATLCRRVRGDRGLSPARSALPGVPVFLLHGRDDTVIPATESERLAERIRGRTLVRLLLTDLISHADADQPAHTADILRLAAFWGDLLSR